MSDQKITLEVCPVCQRPVKSEAGWASKPHVCTQCAVDHATGVRTLPEAAEKAAKIHITKFMSFL